MTDEKRPIPPRRIPRSEYTADFLSNLQYTGQVQSVGETWDEKTMPPKVTWVLYPNGDLQHFRVD